MIHKIKGLYDNGNGLSIRTISQQLGISRNTVRKYLRLDEVAISQAISDPSRSKLLDEHRDHIAFLLGRFPQLSAVKVARKLREKVGELPVSNRTIRRYVEAMKQQGATGLVRYYEPILDDLPGVQCQVDPGEVRGVLIGGEERTVHFVVFVLSYSRLMYVGVSFKPIDTPCFIQLHDEAFRYFGGVPEECVYDQTKLVVIEEQYRELKVNQRFHEYATAARFRVHACEGYDPESKGKVEAGVKYVKQDALYGEIFADQQALRLHLCEWLETVANVRCHGTTGQSPREHFESDERHKLTPYLTPACLGMTSAAGEPRKADKTGLISWQANKYSVPLKYQRALVSVREAEGEVLISDLEHGTLVASHPACQEKGRIIKNNHHYRDTEQRIRDLEADIASLLGQEIGTRLCQRLKATSPKIYKDQLVGVKKLLRNMAASDLPLLEELSHREELLASTVKRHLEAQHSARERGRGALSQPIPTETGSSHIALHVYGQLVRSSGHEVTHESA